MAHYRIISENSYLTSDAMAFSANIDRGAFRRPRCVVSEIHSYPART